MVDVRGMMLEWNHLLFAVDIALDAFQSSFILFLKVCEIRANSFILQIEFHVNMIFQTGDYDFTCGLWDIKIFILELKHCIMYTIKRVVPVFSFGACFHSACFLNAQLLCSLFLHC